MEQTAMQILMTLVENEVTITKEHITNLLTVEEQQIKDGYVMGSIQFFDLEKDLNVRADQYIKETYNK
tara:strand:- start:1386 stop:1589 length:204 start_codon:yes stop_codon:yes gene_type:complete